MRWWEDTIAERRLSMGRDLRLRAAEGEGRTMVMRSVVGTSIVRLGAFQPHAPLWVIWYIGKDCRHGVLKSMVRCGGGSMTNSSNPEAPNLDQAMQNFETIEQTGYQAQESGQQLVRFGKAGQAQVRFLSQEIPKYAEVAQRHPTLQTSFDSFKDWSALVVKKSHEAVTNAGAGTNMLFSALSAATSAVTAGNTPTLNFLSGVYQLQGRESQNIAEVYQLQKPTDPIEPDNEKELNERLAEIDIDLLIGGEAPGMLSILCRQTVFHKPHIH
jgi:hypothetical protein